jgi:hypothetical protein
MTEKFVLPFSILVQGIQNLSTYFSFYLQKRLKSTHPLYRLERGGGGGLRRKVGEVGRRSSCSWLLYVNTI